jgi:hypothetical protein
VKGEYQQVFDVLFDDKGKHIENVVFAPQSTLENGGLQMDQGDFDDIRQRLPFVLTSDELPEYDVLYVGQQKQDELHTYVFDIAPKAIVGKKRYFQGRVWVDDQDFQIVKTFGKTVPDIRPGTRRRVGTGWPGPAAPAARCARAPAGRSRHRACAVTRGKESKRGTFGCLSCFLGKRQEKAPQSK